ncbi:MAG: hypothetical protein K6E76_07465 [Patescibacteria group bacterium]|nr:hypothetical protein [Patescibacteria group bacterium]
MNNTETIGKRPITYKFEKKFLCVFEVLSDNKENQKKHFIVRNKEDFQQIVQKQRNRIPRLNKNDIKEDAPFSKRLEMWLLPEHKDLLRLSEIFTRKLYLSF